jgi:hypothetical protein
MVMLLALTSARRLEFCMSPSVIVITEASSGVGAALEMRAAGVCGGGVLVVAVAVSGCLVSEGLLRKARRMCKPGAV